MSEQMLSAAFARLSGRHEFEHEIMLERQREGVTKATAAGKYKGRVPTARRQSAEVIKLRGQGIKREQIASQLGISRARLQGLEES
jgi:DNA invertase Pin-like site-specific DNA recombinase